MARSFIITYDYLCPYTRNLNEAIVDGLRSGRDWSVRFMPFSLTQSRRSADAPPVWEAQSAEWGAGVRALAWSVAVRDVFPEEFLGFHLEAFSARHERRLDVDDPDVLAEVARRSSLDPSAVADMVAGGDPIARLAADHQEAVRRWSVFGVPTLVVGEQAAFVRLMDRHGIDDVARIVDMMSWTTLNEFKRTKLAR